MIKTYCIVDGALRPACEITGDMMLDVLSFPSVTKSFRGDLWGLAAWHK